jgi:hypothetical protein
MDMHVCKKRKLNAEESMMIAKQLCAVQALCELHKARSVRFSAESSLRILYCSLDETDADTEASDYSPAEPTENETEQITNANVPDEACDTIVTTKLEDGPAPAVLATQKLFRILKDARKINRQQVADLLSSEARRPHNSGGNSKDEPISAHGAMRASCEQTEAAAAAAPLPAQVRTRLEAIAARIAAKGRAPLLPCTTQLGRAYLPAIRFLLTCFAAPAAGAGGVEAMAQG